MLDVKERSADLQTIICVVFRSLPQGNGIACLSQQDWGFTVTVDPSRVDADMLDMFVEREVCAGLLALRRSRRRSPDGHASTDDHP
jgi:hypothetical protein